MGEVFTAVLNVLAIIGLVVVAAFIIVFLTDLLISIIDGKNGIFFKRDKKEKEEVKQLELKDDLEDKKIEQKEEEKIEEKSNVDLELAESERLALLNDREAMIAENEDLKERVAALEKKNEVNEAEEEVEEEKELTDEELDRMYAELLADINREEQEDETEDEEVLEEDEELVEEPVLEEVEEANEVEEVEEVVEPEVNEDDEKISLLEQQIEELKKQLEQQQEEKQSLVQEKETLAQEKENLAKELENRPEIIATEVVETESLEQLLVKKEQLEERLRNANKELKNNKKEYIPLARIKKTLENDEAKLRRREAIVAKKKIMLFGVTNYVVDPEKEKELSEDLDQLEALRLSVEHCQEVMAENNDRYPLLENTNKILKTTVENIKADLDAVNQRIEKLQNNGDDASSADAE